MLRRQYLKAMLGAAAPQPTTGVGAVRALIECIETGNPAGADRLLAPGYRCSGTFGELDRRQWQEAVASLDTRFRNLRVTMEDVLEAHGHVVWRWRLDGVERSTGRSARLDGISIERVSAGRIVESHVVADLYSCLSALGVIIPSEEV